MFARGSVPARLAGHLLGQGALQHGLGHLRQQPIRAQQLCAFRLGTAQQLIGQLVIDRRPAARRALTFAAHLRSV